MFNLSRGGVSAPMTNSPQFSTTPYPRYTPIQLGSVSPRQYSVGTSTPVELNTNTVHGVSPITTAGLPTMSSIIASVNDTNVMRDTPSYVLNDNLGAIDRADWEDFSDVNFYVGTDGKYHSTEPFFERLFWRESKNNLNAVDKKKLHLGPAQFDEGTWRRVMPGVDVSYRTNADYAGKAAANYAGINARTLRKAGVPLNAATIYGAHNLGAGTIINMYKNLDAPLTGQDLNFVLGNFNDAKEYAPELYKKYIRDPNSITGRDYMNLINAIFTN